MQQKKKTQQPRKAAWQCQDLAWKIDVGARHYATKLVLLFLAKTANESLKSYHGYRSISAHTGLTFDAIRKAILRLRDEFKILTWERGRGGRRDDADTNDYKLNLTAMKDLVKQQDVFDVATGRLLKYLETPQPTSNVPERTLLPTSKVNVASEHENVASEHKNVTTHTSETLRESNSQILQRSEEPAPAVFCETKQLEKVKDIFRDMFREPLPRCAAPLPTASAPSGESELVILSRQRDDLQRDLSLFRGEERRLHYGSIEYASNYRLQIAELNKRIDSLVAAGSNSPASPAETGSHVQ